MCPACRGPLAVIFAISGIKEGIDDMRRYRADQAANQRLLNVMRDGKWVRIASQQLLVGDLIKIAENEEIPADVLLLKSSEEKLGGAYIQTSNLDGETNLKQRFSASKDILQPMSEYDMSHLNISIECAHPNNNLYNFDSTLRIPAAPASGEPDAVFPLTGDNLLLQATYLRNTTWVIGLVVYTGNETKVGCNKSKPHQKYTKIDEGINRVTLVVFAVQLAMIVVWGIIGSIMENHSKDAAQSGGSGDHWYLNYNPQSDSGFVGGIIIPLRFLLLASMMIPISLKVSLDMIKLYYSLLIGWDVELFDKLNNVGPKATNTSIAENLGQVRFVLSDKTGTLTENVMVLRRVCTAGGVRYGEEPTPERTFAAAMAVADEAEAEAEKHAAASSSSSSSSGGLGARPSVDHRSTMASASASNAAVAESILGDPVLLKALYQREEALVFLLKTMSLCNTVVPSYVQLPIEAGAGSSHGAYDAPSSAPEAANGGILPGSPNALEMATSLANNSSALDGALALSVKDRDDPAPPGIKRSKSRPGVGVDRAESLLQESLLPSDSMSHIGLASETRKDQMTPSASFAGAPQLSRAPTSAARPPAAAPGMRTSIHYASSSPDELSLVEFAAQTGVKLLEKNGNTLRISIDPHVESHSSGGSTAWRTVAQRPASASPVQEDWEVLHVLEFSSERKRMSVLIRQVDAAGMPLPRDEGRITLLCKGADDVMLARVDMSPDHPTNPQTLASTRAALDDYASAGLRTLCFGSRILSPQEFATFHARCVEAHLDIHARDAALHAAYETVEKDFTLVGCSGIEDKLQQDVGKTISALREANIKVWMITGDKFQTAKEISKSCELYRPKRSRAVAASSQSMEARDDGGQGDELYHVQGSSPSAIKSCLDSIVSRALDSLTNRALHPYCLIVDGNTLVMVLSPQFENVFALIALQAVSVICCRTTPAQKAQMVSLVQYHSAFITDSDIGEEDDAFEAFAAGSARGSHRKEDSEGNVIPRHIRSSHGLNRDHSHSTRVTGGPAVHKKVGWFSSLTAPQGAVVLAIGDGGNDVSMIQRADVGVGIVGKEGLQASRASDFSFSQFRFLTRLLLVHGRYSFNRTAFIAQYCFYKSLFICLVQLGFAFLSEFSGSSYFDSYSLVTYNLFYTSVPTMLYVLEQDLSPVMLQANPRLYAVSCQRGEGFTRQTMWQWMVRGVLQALVLLIAAVVTHHGESASLAFGPEGQVSNALVIYTACVLVHPLTIALESTYITSLHWIILGGTLALFLFTNLALSVVRKTLDVYGIYPVLLTDGEYYLRVILLTGVCILPVLACKYIKQKSVSTRSKRMGPTLSSCASLSSPLWLSGVCSCVPAIRPRSFSAPVKPTWPTARCTLRLTVPVPSIPYHPTPPYLPARATLLCLARRSAIVPTDWKCRGRPCALHSPRKQMQSCTTGQTRRRQRMADTRIVAVPCACAHTGVVVCLLLCACCCVSVGLPPLACYSVVSTCRCQSRRKTNQRCEHTTTTAAITSSPLLPVRALSHS